MIMFAVTDQPKTMEGLLRAAEPKAGIYSFPNGAETLKFASRMPCDVAFIDMDAAKTDGVELAKGLQKKNPRVNLVFTAGLENWALEAIKLRASGYVLKPVTPEKVRDELDHLRNPVERGRKRVRFKCFGNFEVFIDNEPVKFKRSKTKEYLAYLVDRGVICSTAEIEAVIFERVYFDSYIRQLRKDLVDTFTEKGCENALILEWNRQGIRTQLVDCDYYRWLAGDPEASKAYRGEYMSQYSWAEFTCGALK